MEKTVFKIIRGQLLPEEMRFKNTKISPIYFLKFYCDYDLNLCRCLNPDYLKYATWVLYNIFSNPSFFVCATLFPRVKLE
jgi:hypothetical protein